MDQTWSRFCVFEKHNSSERYLNFIKSHRLLNVFILIDLRVPLSCNKTFIGYRFSCQQGHRKLLMNYVLARESLLLILISNVLLMPPLQFIETVHVYSVHLNTMSSKWYYVGLGIIRQFSSHRKSKPYSPSYFQWLLSLYALMENPLLWVYGIPNMTKNHWPGILLIGAW